MSKEYEKFCRENEGVAENLLGSLEALFNKFEQGIIPGEPEKSDALYMLDVYKDAIELFEKLEASTFKRVMAKKTMFDEEAVYKELSGLKDAVSLLTKIGREKLLEKEDPIFQSDEGKVLLEGDFFDEIFVEGSDKRYYALSAKAEKTLKSKNITNKIKEDVATAIIPDRMIVESEKWNNIYFKRVEFLKRFYTGCRTDREYILFTLDDAKEMVFACELANTEDVTYVFAGVFDEKIDDHISQLIGLSNSGMIDNIEIIVDSLEMARILEEEGITSVKTPHISIVQM